MLLTPLNDAKQIVEAFVSNYTKLGAYLFSCDRASAKLYMDKIVEAGGSFCNVCFTLCSRGIIVRRIEDVMCRYTRIIPTTNGPDVETVVVFIDDLIKGQIRMQ